MQVNQNLAELSARALTGVSELLTHLKPDAVIIQGDTTTAAVAGLAAFYQRIPVGHVEAGLRTGNIYSPFPEEINRRITGVLASLHFAPTKMAVDALLAERVDPGSVFLVGNTVVDALRLTVARKDEITPAINFSERSECPYPNRFVLVTAHRRESFGSPFESICRAVRSLVERNGDVEVVYPVHLNPNVRDPVSRLLQGIPRINLIEPVNYQQFVQLMLRSYLILTDSGGIQEEATVLGKPTLVMRETTERREAVEAGTALLVGTDESRILSTAENLLHDRDAYERMAQANSPFGNGYSSQEIVRILQRHLEAADT
jgi:UDP-N-acetylglucosamine 2-epimerase